MTKSLAARREAADKALADYRHAARACREERTALKALRRDVVDAHTAQEILQAAAQGVQQQAHAQIAKVVTRCLRAVGFDYDFRVVFERKHGKTGARLTFVRGGHECSPTGAAGGGAVDVAALALRLVCLLLAKPRRRRLVVLDEPFKNVHGTAKRERCAQLVAALADELGFQFIIATGLDWLRPPGAKVVEIGGGG